MRKEYKYTFEAVLDNCVFVTHDSFMGERPGCPFTNIMYCRRCKEHDAWWGRGPKPRCMWNDKQWASWAFCVEKEFEDCAR
jgi:hypothetical protein